MIPEAAQTRHIIENIQRNLIMERSIWPSLYIPGKMRWYFARTTCNTGRSNMAKHLICFLLSSQFKIIICIYSNQYYNFWSWILSLLLHTILTTLFTLKTRTIKDDNFGFVFICCLVFLSHGSSIWSSGCLCNSSSGSICKDNNIDPNMLK